MSRRMIVLLALLGLPYGYLALYWTSCFATRCQSDGHKIFYTLVALGALPFLMAFIGGVFALGGARRVRTAAASRTPTSATVIEGARGGAGLWIGVSLMASALPACAALLYLVLDTPEPGRDRLGRICETSSGSTTCRPDPEADRPSELEQINHLRERRRSAD
ncbi:MAG: hypothetical protein EAY70_14085 [Sphingomonadales bacterium]|nr:MAG: hypothetical protein EAY70_14085 [Sphingomonadales bacterium]